jgi:NitT/TauT family transport system substrate-binding protein
MRAAGWLLAALALSGCARNEGARSPPPAKPVRVAMLPNLSLAPLLIADEEGRFGKHGVAVEFVPLARSPDGLPSLMDGTLDVLASALRPAVLNAIARGGEFRLVADKGHFDPAGCTYVALMARPGLVRDGQLWSPEPAKRWRFSISRDSTGVFLLERALVAARIPPERMQIDNLDRAAEEQALRSGAVDVAMVTGTWVDRTRRTGSGEVWLPAQSVLPDHQFLLLLFGRRLLRDDPEAGVRFMAAYLEGARQYGEGKTERNLDILHRRTGLDRETLTSSCWIPIRADGRINVPSVLDYQAWALGKGLLDRALAAEEFWEPRFVQLAAEKLGPPTPAADAR